MRGVAALLACTIVLTGCSSSADEAPVDVDKPREIGESDVCELVPVERLEKVAGDAAGRITAFRAIASGHPRGLRVPRSRRHLQSRRRRTATRAGPRRASTPQKASGDHKFDGGFRDVTAVVEGANSPS